MRLSVLVALGLLGFVKAQEVTQEEPQVEEIVEEDNEPQIEVTQAAEVEKKVP